MTTLDRQPEHSTEPGTASTAAPARAAAIAAKRVARAEVLLGVAGLASVGLAFLRLFETWRVSPHTVSHHVMILGYTLSYPVANMAAVVIVVLALLGMLVTARALLGLARELAAAWQFERRLAAARRPHPAGALVIDDERPHAFCAGLLRPRVYVTTGALEILDESALAAVLTHERHHARHRDPLRLATSRVLARAMFFLPAIRALGTRHQALAELSADESAINAAPGNRSALARAMLRFTDSAQDGDSVGIDLARVDYLLGEPPGWRFPIVMWLAAVGLLGLMVATAVLVGKEAAGSATLAPPFLSAQPCVIVFAMIPAAVGLVAIWLWRRDRRL
jgi:Zn-dependent protease with chaperone function